MTNLRVESRTVIESVEGRETNYVVRVTDLHRPWLEVELRVLSWHDGGPEPGDEFWSHRLIGMNLTCANVADAFATTTLHDGDWWRMLFEAVLVHLAYETPAFDRACGRNPDTFTYQFLWDGDYLWEERIPPSTRAPVSRSDAEIAENAAALERFETARAAGRIFARFDREPTDVQLGRYLAAIAGRLIPNPPADEAVTAVAAAAAPTLESSGPSKQKEEDA